MPTYDEEESPAGWGMLHTPYNDKHLNDKYVNGSFST